MAKETRSIRTHTHTHTKKLNKLGNNKVPRTRITYRRKKENLGGKKYEQNRYRRRAPKKFRHKEYDTELNTELSTRGAATAALAGFQNRYYETL